MERENLMEKESSPFDKLIPDCLNLIFNCLPPADLTRIERVSKGWQIAAKNSWNKTRKLSLYPKELGVKSNRQVYLTEDDYKNILRRCGKYLKEIDLPYQHEFGQFDSALLIAEHCENIEVIKNAKFSSESAKKLKENCKNITELVKISFFIKNINDKKETLVELFSNNKKLKVLDFQTSSKEIGDCVLNLPLAQMKCIKLGDCNVLESLLASTKSLNILKCFITNSVNEVRAIASDCLTELRLCLNIDVQDREDMDRSLSEVFKRNRNIKSLTLHKFNELNGSCFFSLNEKVFEELDLRDCYNIKKDNVTKTWPNFKNFKQLRLRNCKNFDNLVEGLGLCSSLEVFYTEFMNITEKNFLEATSKSKNLKSLTIAHMIDADFSIKIFNFISSNFKELNHLSLVNLDSIDSDVQPIFKLPKLKYLEIIYLKRLIGLVFYENIKNIKILDCRYGIGLKTECLINFLRYCNDLEELDIRGCYFMNINLIIDTAVEVLNKRSNNATLTIYTDFIDLSYRETMLNKAPLLNISNDRVEKNDFLNQSILIP